MSDARITLLAAAIGLAGLAICLGVALVLRMAINKFMAISAISKLKSRLNAWLEKTTEAAGEILAGLILVGFQVGGFLLVLYGLVRFVKWAWVG